MMPFKIIPPATIAPMSLSNPRGKAALLGAPVGVVGVVVGVPV